MSGVFKTVNRFPPMPTRVHIFDPTAPREKWPYGVYELPARIVREPVYIVVREVAQKPTVEQVQAGDGITRDGDVIRNAGRRVDVSAEPGPSLSEAQAGDLLDGAAGAEDAS